MVLGSRSFQTFCWMRWIRAACKRIQEDQSILDMATNERRTMDLPFEPKITVVVVQKKQGTRIMPANPQDAVAGPSRGNAPPGTVCDTKIVSALRTDILLLSHVAIQGTSRPTRYQVLWDDTEFTMDELQLLTYQLCFMLCQSMKSMSYPAPTYYAHLAAARARTYVTKLNDDVLADIAQVNSRIRGENLSATFPMF